MDTKPCSRCQRSADFSFYILLSTVGARPRIQKSSKSVLFCASCMSRFISSLAESQPQLHGQFHASFTAIAGHSSLAIQAKDSLSNTSKENQ